MLLVWFRCADVDTGCLLKTAEATLLEVTASHEPQRQAEWKTSKEGEATKRIKASLLMYVAYI